MFAWLKRLFRIGAAEANAALDKLEDPIKMTEQGIKDLKTDLQKSMTALAEVKASAIRAKKELEQAKSNANEYEKKAVALLQKAQAGEIAPEEADRLATRALAKKDQLLQQVAAAEKNVALYDTQTSKMDQNVQRLKSQISTWDTELKTLKARSKVSEASKNINKQLANVDSSSTLSMLEKMKEKVDEQEALAQSYSDMADLNVSEDDEIDRALGAGFAANSSLESGTQSEALLALKAKMAAGASSSSSASSSSASSDEPSADSGSGSTGNSELDKLKSQLKNNGDNA